METDIDIDYEQKKPRLFSRLKSDVCPLHPIMMYGIEYL